jgi:hypothetical protein
MKSAGRSSYTLISAEGAAYEEARTKLDALLANDQKLIAIRTDS